MSIGPLPVRAGNWCGAYVERQPLVGSEVWSVTISGPGRDARRRLFPDRPSAYAFALEQAEEQDLPVFDLADAGETP